MTQLHRLAVIVTSASGKMLWVMGQTGHQQVDYPELWGSSSKRAIANSDKPLWADIEETGRRRSQLASMSHHQLHTRKWALKSLVKDYLDFISTCPLSTIFWTLGWDGTGHLQVVLSSWSKGVWSVSLIIWPALWSPGHQPAGTMCSLSLTSCNILHLLLILLIGHFHKQYTNLYKTH